MAFTTTQRRRVECLDGILDTSLPLGLRTCNRCPSQAQSLAPGGRVSHGTCDCTGTSRDGLFVAVFISDTIPRSTSVRDIAQSRYGHSPLSCERAGRRGREGKIATSAFHLMVQPIRAHKSSTAGARRRPWIQVTVQHGIPICTTPIQNSGTIGGSRRHSHATWSEEVRYVGNHGVEAASNAIGNPHLAADSGGLPEG